MKNIPRFCHINLMDYEKKDLEKVKILIMTNFIRMNIKLVD